jgi:hypothetical protein
VQNPSSFCFLSKNLNIKIHRNIILPVILYGCETWSLTLKKAHKLKVFGKRVLSRIFGSKMKKWQEAGKDSIMRSLVVCTIHHILLR